MQARLNKQDKRKVVYDGRFLKFFTYGAWEYIQRKNCTAIVIIVAVTKEQDVVFVEQYRPPVGRIVIEFPAGLANDRGLRTKETALAAAKRELVEETGYKAGRMVKMFDGPVSSGSSADLVTMYLARDVEKVAQGGGDEFESIIVHSVPLQQVDAWLARMKRRGCLVEPKIYAGLYFLKSYNTSP
jgi:ADP-ribose pyrophosphatase